MSPRALVRHFDQLPARELDRLFGRRPQGFSAASAQLGYYLGATLYMKGTRLHLAEDLARQRARGTASIILDLEDAIADDAVVGAQRTSSNSSAPLLPRVRAAVGLCRVRHDLRSAKSPVLSVRHDHCCPDSTAQFDSCPRTAAWIRSRPGAEYGHRFSRCQCWRGRALAYRETRASVLAPPRMPSPGTPTLCP
jgi:hypothetical protein